MTERTLTEGLMGAISAVLRGAVVIKHNDRSTGGIPDVQVLYADTASWIEVKYLRVDRLLRDIVEMRQLLFGHQLATVCGGRSWVVVYEEDETTLWQPQVLAKHIWPQVVGPLLPGHVPFRVPSAWISASNQRNLHRLLGQHGILRTDGHSHDFPVRLLGDAIALRGL